MDNTTSYQNLPIGLQAQISQMNPALARAVLRAWLAKQAREEQERAKLSPPSPTDRTSWGGFLSQAEKLLLRWRHWEALGPLAPMIQLLIAQALRFGARRDPSREAVIFLAQWELATMLGVSVRTIERYLHDPRYERYRAVARKWIAWRVWMTDGEGIGAPGAVRGGTVWRVRVRPIFRRRLIQVLAPYLRWPWRDLAADRKRGATARILARSSPRYEKALLIGYGVTLQGVVGKPLASLIQRTPLRTYPDTDIGRDLRELLRVASIPRGRDGRRRWAEAVAAKIATALRDHHSKRFWLCVAWAALRAVIFGGWWEDPLRALFRAVQITKEAMADGFARNPGAYAQAMLHRVGFWELTAPFKEYRVG